MVTWLTRRMRWAWHVESFVKQWITYLCWSHLEERNYKYFIILGKTRKITCWGVNCINVAANRIKCIYWGFRGHRNVISYCVKMKSLLTGFGSAKWKDRPSAVYLVYIFSETHITCSFRDDEMSVRSNLVYER